MAADNIKSDVYRMMDEAGVTYAGFTNPKKPGLRIVNEMRNELAARVDRYVKAREAKIREEYERSQQ